jgi:hypothetical protein
MRTLQNGRARAGSTTVRLKPESHRVLKQLAETTGQSLQAALEDAIEEKRRRLYLEGANADYAALKRDPKAMAEFIKETGAWDITNLDGLEKQ